MKPLFPIVVVIHLYIKRDLLVRKTKTCRLFYTGGSADKLLFFASIDKGNILDIDRYCFNNLTKSLKSNQVIRSNSH